MVGSKKPESRSKSWVDAHSQHCLDSFYRYLLSNLHEQMFVSGPRRSEGYWERDKHLDYKPSVLDTGCQRMTRADMRERQPCWDLLSSLCEDTLILSAQ